MKQLMFRARPAAKRESQPASAGQQCDTPYRHGNCHLIELNNVVKEYATAAGKFTALKGVSLQGRHA